MAAAFWDWDIASGAVWFSEGWQALLGYEPGAIEPHIEAYNALIHPEDRAAADETLTRHLDSKAAFYASEHRLRCADGQWLWVLDRGRVVERDGDGRPLRMVGTRADIDARKRADLARQDSETRLELALESTGAWAWDWNVATGTFWYNKSWQPILGYAEGEISGDLSDFDRLVHPADKDEAARAVKDHLKGRSAAFDVEYRIRAKDGRWLWVADRGKVIQRGADGSPLRVVGTRQDISARKAAEAELRASKAHARLREEQLQLAVTTTGLGIWDYQFASRRRQWSRELRDILGVDAAAPARTKAFLDLVNPADRAAVEEFARRARAGVLDDFKISFRIWRAADGAERWVETNGCMLTADDGRAARLLITFRDITEQRRSEEKIRWTGSHDALTGLLNRAAFQEQLEATLRRADAAKRKFGLLMLDLDNFKDINDTLGHDAGDMLLRTVAERLRSVLRPTDIIARHGGDEFAIILPELSDRCDASQLLETMLARIEEPILAAGRLLDCRLSIGMTLFPDDGVQPSDLLKNADIALYAAKAAGRGRAELYAPHMRKILYRRATVATHVREALAGDAVLPHYQPKVCLASGKLIGFEALLRWRHPKLGLQRPGTIDTAFEDPVLAVALSERMLDRVVADMRRWRNQGLDFKHVAVNAAAAEFRRGDFAERVLRRLQEAGIPPQQFELEVTETVFLGRAADGVGTALRELSAAGVTIALDDFGTGYASLSHLKQFPVDVIKIERSFIRHLGAKGNDAAIVRALIGLGRNLGIGIVAEGVETGRQASLLKTAGCDYAQGNLFGLPADSDQTAMVIAEWPVGGASALSGAAA